MAVLRRSIPPRSTPRRPARHSTRCGTAVAFGHDHRGRGVQTRGPGSGRPGRQRRRAPGAVDDWELEVCDWPQPAMTTTAVAGERQQIHDATREDGKHSYYLPDRPGRARHPRRYPSARLDGVEASRIRPVHRAPPRRERCCAFIAMDEMGSDRPRRLLQGHDASCALGAAYDARYRLPVEAGGKRPDARPGLVCSTVLDTVKRLSR